MLDLAIGIFDDAVIREAHQAGGQTLHTLPRCTLLNRPALRR